MTWWLELGPMIGTAVLVVIASGLGAGWAVFYNKISKTLMWTQGVVSEDDLAQGVIITEDDMPKEELFDEDWMIPGDREIRPRKYDETDWMAAWVARPCKE